MTQLLKLQSLRWTAYALSAFVLAVVLGVVPGMVGPARAASAVGSLTTEELTAAQQALKTALADINPNLTGVAQQNAVSQALAQVTGSLVGTYGNNAVCAITQSALQAGIAAPQAIAAIYPAAVKQGVPLTLATDQLQTCAVAAGADATTVAQAIIASGAQQGFATNLIGTGLGQAATELAQTNSNAANAIGQVISNEGTNDMGQSFSVAVLANGGSQQLADSGVLPPTATGSIGGGAAGGGGGQSPGLGTSFTALPVCTNPSCT